MSILVPIFLVIAQGAAIFATAYLLFQAYGGKSALAKFGWMSLSYFGWVAFTFVLFYVLGTDVYLIPAVGSVTALASSAVYLIAWIVLAQRKAGAHA